MAVLESELVVFLNGTTQSTTQQGSCDGRLAMQTARVASGMSELWELGGESAKSSFNCAATSLAGPFPTPFVPPGGASSFSHTTFES